MGQLGGGLPVPMIGHHPESTCFTANCFLTVLNHTSVQASCSSHVKREGKGLKNRARLEEGIATAALVFQGQLSVLLLLLFLRCCWACANHNVVYR